VSSGIARESKSASLIRRSRSRAAIRQEHRKSKAGAPRLERLSRAGDVPAESEEDVNELDEDDFALGEGSSDDEDLSSMVSDATVEEESDLGLPDLSDDLQGDEDSMDAPSAGVSHAEGHVSDIERLYEDRHHRSDAPEPSTSAVKKLLPIKLADGKLARHPDDITTPTRPERNRVVFSPPRLSSTNTERQAELSPPPTRDPLGQRFGRPAVRSVLEIENKAERLKAAKAEIAHLGREIIADPENSVGFSRAQDRVSRPILTGAICV
jgi:nucleolar complex protein 3